MDLALFRAIVDRVRPAWQVHEVDGEPSIGMWHFGEPMVYRRFAESVEHCHARGLRVSISTNPSVWTERRIEEILELGVDELFVTVDGMDELTSRAIRGQAASAEEHRARSQYPCYYPWHSVSVTWEGTVVPCCRDHNRHLVLGDLTRESLESIWNSEPMQQLRREFTRGPVPNPLCANCTERSAEIGLPGRNYPIARLLGRRTDRLAALR